MDTSGPMSAGSRAGGGASEFSRKHPPCKGGYMCDYSLGEIRNRLAVEGEELIVHRFPTHSIGLASPADLRPKSGPSARDQNLWQRIKNLFAPAFDCHNAPAVCIPPGACLILKGIPLDLQRKWGVGEEESVLFVQ